jgi:hypothetical protein
MAYAVTDQFDLITSAGLTASPRFWYHESADALAAANTSGFITDGTPKGLKVGDFVYHLDTTGATGDLSLHRVLTVSSTYPGAVDLTDGTVVCAGANGD